MHELANIVEPKAKRCFEVNVPFMAATPAVLEALSGPFSFPGKASLFSPAGARTACISTGKETHRVKLHPRRRCRLQRVWLDSDVTGASTEPESHEQCV